jgi:hypothetical protein
MYSNTIQNSKIGFHFMMFELFRSGSHPLGVISYASKHPVSR